MAGPPPGTVTFVFTAVGSSTARRERDRAAMAAAVNRRRARSRGAVAADGGMSCKVVGGAQAAFHGRRGSRSAGCAAGAPARAVDRDRALGLLRDKARGSTTDRSGDNHRGRCPACGGSGRDAAQAKREKRAMRDQGPSRPIVTVQSASERRCAFQRPPVARPACVAGRRPAPSRGRTTGPRRLAEGGGSAFQRLVGGPGSAQRWCRRPPAPRGPPMSRGGCGPV